MTKPLISFFIILASLGFTFFYARPEYYLIKERKSELGILEGASKDKETIQGLINDTSKTLKDINIDDLEKFDVFLPTTIDPVRFANNVQRMGMKHGIVLDDISVESPDEGKNGSENNSNANGTVRTGIDNTLSLEKKINRGEGTIAQGTNTTTAVKDEYAITEVSFTFTATYEKFKLLLNDIQTSLGLMNITKLSFSEDVATSDQKRPKKGDPILYKFNVTIASYSLK